MNVKPSLRQVLLVRKNGELLSLAEQAGFEVFLTIDRGIEYEQNLATCKLAVIIIHAKSS